MTLAFIITAVVAGIMFFLWISARESLTEAEGKILQLDKHIQELQVNSERIIAPRQTKLTMELIHDVVRDNGFVPHQYEEDWVTFKRQGEEYFVGSKLTVTVNPNFYIKEKELEFLIIKYSQLLRKKKQQLRENKT